MEATRCKFRCDHVTSFGNGSKTVKMSAVVSGSDENKSFWKWTPSGSFEMQCVNENVNFEPGKEYFLDISESTAPAAQ